MFFLSLFGKKKIAVAAFLDRYPGNGFDELPAKAVGVGPLGRNHEDVILFDGRTEIGISPDIVGGAKGA